MKQVPALLPGQFGQMGLIEDGDQSGNKEQRGGGERKPQL